MVENYIEDLKKALALKPPFMIDCRRNPDRKIWPLASVAEARKLIEEAGYVPVEFIAGQREFSGVDVSEPCVLLLRNDLVEKFKSSKSHRD